MDGVVRGGECVRYAAYIERTYVYTYTNLFEYEPGENWRRTGQELPTYNTYTCNKDYLWIFLKEIVDRFKFLGYGIVSVLIDWLETVSSDFSTLKITYINIQEQQNYIHIYIYKRSTINCEQQGWEDRMSSSCSHKANDDDYWLYIYSMK